MNSMDTLTSHPLATESVNSVVNSLLPDSRMSPGTLAVWTTLRDSRFRRDAEHTLHGSGFRFVFVVCFFP